MVEEKEKNQSLEVMQAMIDALDDPHARFAHHLGEQQPKMSTKVLIHSIDR
jgi:hypothetical protein